MTVVNQPAYQACRHIAAANESNSVLTHRFVVPVRLGVSRTYYGMWKLQSSLCESRLLVIAFRGSAYFPPLAEKLGQGARARGAIALSRTAVALVCQLAALSPHLSLHAQSTALPESSFVVTHYSSTELSRPAEQGDVRAAYLLGTRHSSGRGRTRDDSRAIR